jgi:hypothetical protein
MKTLTLITGGFFVVSIVSAASTDRLTRISNETGVPVATLQAQHTATGFGYGELENANLLANASGQSFDTIVAKRQAGEGWGKIAQDYGFKLGDIVSTGHRSNQATRHAHGRAGKRGSHLAQNRGPSREELAAGRHGVDRSHGPFNRPDRGKHGQQSGQGNSHH